MLQARLQQQVKVQACPCGTYKEYESNTVQTTKENWIRTGAMDVDQHWGDAWRFRDYDQCKYVIYGIACCYRVVLGNMILIGETCTGNCPTGSSCGSGDICASGKCTGSRCAAPTCADGIQNGDGEFKILGN